MTVRMLVRIGGARKNRKRSPPPPLSLSLSLSLLPSHTHTPGRPRASAALSRDASLLPHLSVAPSGGAGAVFLSPQLLERDEFELFFVHHSTFAPDSCPRVQVYKY